MLGVKVDRTEIMGNEKVIYSSLACRSVLAGGT